MLKILWNLHGRFCTKIDWHGRDFLTEYNRVLESDLDPVALFASADDDFDGAMAQAAALFTCTMVRITAVSTASCGNIDFFNGCGHMGGTKMKRWRTR